MRYPAFLRRWALRWAKGYYARWPRRVARRPVGVLLVKVLPRASASNLGLNHLLRQAGYTSGDSVVMLLERDYARVCELASKRIENPMMQMVVYLAESRWLEGMRVPPDLQNGGEFPRVEP